MRLMYRGVLSGLLCTVLLSVLTLWQLGSINPGGIQVTGNQEGQRAATEQTHKPSTSTENQSGNQMTTVASSISQQRRIVVVGGGLAGLSAAISAHAELESIGAVAVKQDLGSLTGSDNNVEIVIVDKMPKLGGNSAKASTGINAVYPAGGDSPEVFQQDIIKSGGGLSKPDLVSKLVEHSQAAIQFLESFGVDLSKVVQAGGHTIARSRSNPSGGNVGWSIMSKMIAAVKQLPGVRVMEGYKLEELVKNIHGAVTGVIVSASTDNNDTGKNQVMLPAQAVILATGGYAANRDMLQAHAPVAAALATTNGPWAQGDALSVAEEVGAALIDLDQVQIHPTGFIDPADPQSGTKFLAPEKLRGVGGIMLNKEGKRFVDELTTRDKVSEILASQPGSEAWLLLSEAAAQEYGIQAIQFYVAKGLMTKVEGVEGLSQHTHVPAAVLTSELESYSKSQSGTQADPFGKTAFTGPLLSDVLSGTMYVARVTPVVHYTMGGIAMDTQARALTAAGTPISGLYVAGEASAGVHGRNRLGGNSLLECVVYGRTAGREAAQHVATQSHPVLEMTASAV